MSDDKNPIINMHISNKFAPVALASLLGLLCAMAISNSVHKLDIEYGGGAGAHFHEYIMISAIWIFVFGFSSGLLINSTNFNSKREFFLYLILPSLTLFIAWLVIPLLSVIDQASQSYTAMIKQGIYAAIAAAFSWFTIVFSSLGREVLIDSGRIDKIKEWFVVFQGLLIAVGALYTAIGAFLKN